MPENLKEETKTDSLKYRNETGEEKDYSVDKIPIARRCNSVDDIVQELVVLSHHVFLEPLRRHGMLVSTPCTAQATSILPI